MFPVSEWLVVLCLVIFKQLVNVQSVGVVNQEL